MKTRADDGTDARVGRLSDSPAFRTARAKLAALTLHQMRPNAAREAGRKGGFATAEKHPGGRKAWGLQMAMKGGTTARLNMGAVRLWPGPAAMGVASLSRAW